MKYAGKTVYLVISEGEIVNACEDGDEAESLAFEINNENTNEAARDAGYDPDELSDDETAEFAFAGGFDGYAYSDSVTIPEEKDTDDTDDEDSEESNVSEESEFYTSEGDTFTYSDVIDALDEMYSNKED